jgi:Uma2 family endonuclease
VKADLYAEAGVPEYWVLNLVDRELVIFRSAHEGVYRRRTTHRAGDRVAPEAWPDVALEVSELFSGEESP